MTYLLASSPSIQVAFAGVSAVASTGVGGADAGSGGLVATPCTGGHHQLPSTLSLPSASSQWQWSSGFEVSLPALSTAPTLDIAVFELRRIVRRVPVAKRCPCNDVQPSVHATAPPAAAAAPSVAVSMGTVHLAPPTQPTAVATEAPSSTSAGHAMHHNVAPSTVMGEGAGAASIGLEYDEVEEFLPVMVATSTVSVLGLLGLHAPRGPRVRKPARRNSLTHKGGSRCLVEPLIVDCLLQRCLYRRWDGCRVTSPLIP
jgi:hypothetical protein